MTIPLTENAEHQLAVLLDFMIREIASGGVDVTGWKLLEKPTVEVGKDGIITMQFAIPALTEAEPEPLPVRKGKKMQTFTQGNGESFELEVSEG